MKKVKLTKSICGAFKMAYFAGDIIEVNEALATEIVQAGFGEFVTEPEPKQVETATEKPQTEKATKRK